MKTGELFRDKGPHRNEKEDKSSGEEDVPEACPLGK